MSSVLTVTSKGPHEPFDGASALDADVRQSLGSYLRDVADRLGLRDWDIRVSEGVAEPKSAIAATFIRENAREAVVAFADDFFARPETYRRTTLEQTVDGLAWGVARWMPPSPDGPALPAPSPHAHGEGDGAVHA